MRITEENGKTLLTGSYNPSELYYLVNYLIGLGSNVRINHPIELRDAYLKELKKIINMYE